MVVKGAQTVGFQIHPGSLVVLHQFPSVAAMLWTYRLNRLKPNRPVFLTPKLYHDWKTLSRKVETTEANCPFLILFARDVRMFL